MHLITITPAQPDSKAGNRATAERWKSLLETAGHSVEVVTEYHGEPCDAFIALHAWRSVYAIRQFRETWPGKPLIVALTGTDLYHHQYEYPDDTRYSMSVADALVGLHDLVAHDMPPGFASKLVTLYQSAEGPEALPAPQADLKKGSFGVCVIGHLRDEKDALRAAYAARLLPEESKIQVFCAGKALKDEWRHKAEREMTENPRFHWLGELDKTSTRQLMTNSQVMVISSVMEGGANVVSEACRAGLPVLASDIPGNVGLLGRDYAGYFPVGDEQALAELLCRSETDPRFLATLKKQVGKLAGRFIPEKERASLEQALHLAMQHCSQRR
ncbi:putative glycosyltransferase, TIGR04348 family [Marinobacter sp. es.042]|uniref:selenoneine biosynthesis selenosugar synthase SenB n=1 Tax=Marinobacter sp. es.042 TaxID=1761794 RepID=UPI000B50491B|nr:selenoneine biosynthesis selenosugar synthase SenB [Marinobacter sp. es.042]SNB55744.1 putative glycosyltransferase, TIGR04348 family [Marinobacter sp. es.042]